jgi:hypothetical protein
MQLHTSAAWTHLWGNVSRRKLSEQFLSYCDSRKRGPALPVQLDGAERKDSHTHSSTAFEMTASRFWQSCIYRVDPAIG